MSVRTSQEATGAAETLLPNPDRLQRLRIGPLSPGALHHLLRERTGHALTRPASLRILGGVISRPVLNGMHRIYERAA